MGRQEFEGTFNYRKNVVLVIKVDPIWVVSVSFYYFLLFVYFENSSVHLSEKTSPYTTYKTDIFNYTSWKNLQPIFLS